MKKGRKFELGSDLMLFGNAHYTEKEIDTMEAKASISEKVKFILERGDAADISFLMRNVSIVHDTVKRKVRLSDLEKRVAQLNKRVLQNDISEQKLQVGRKTNVMIH